jgi:hypothetical protein
MYNVVLPQAIIKDLPLAISCMDNQGTKTAVGTSSEVLTFTVEDDPTFRIDLMQGSLI